MESVRGAQRYFEGSLADLNPKVLEIFLWVDKGVLKKISDFSRLMVIPELWRR